MPRIKKIISGGQTGADRAALDVAIEMGIPHGGWIPKDRKTEAGPLPVQYRLQEMPSDSYAERTEKNVLDSDGTLIFSHGTLTGGSALTRQLAKDHGKPWLHLDLHQMAAMEAAHKVVEWIGQNSIEVLNVVGPRASHDPQIYDDVKAILKVVVKRMRPNQSETREPDEGKYELALTVVTEWVEELMSAGHTRDEALQALLVLVEMRMFATQSEEIGQYETELVAVIRSQLGEAQD